MSSPAFLKFKSLEKRSQSVGRPGSGPVSGPFPINERPSPDQGLGSSVSSSTTSLQQPASTKSTDLGLLESNKIGGSPRASNMAALRAQFFEEKIPKTNETIRESDSKETIENNSSAIKQSEITDDENKVLDRRKSSDESGSSQNKKT